MADAILDARSITLTLAELSHIGDRASNQDALGSARQDDLACMVISDGAGGHEGGEIAAKTVVGAVIESFMRESSFGARALRSYIDHAIVQVADRKRAEEKLKDMSATVAAVLIDLENRSVLWAHMGDTRIYFFRRSKIYRVTKDHSLVQQFIDAGYCAADKLRSHPQRSSLFAAIGAEGDTPPEVTQEVAEIRDGDAFLICTDGFWEWITEDDMEKTLASSESAEAWLSSMNAIAAKAVSKSRDNYTAFAVWLGQPELITIIQ